MSGETESQPSGLSVDNLNNQFARLMAERDKRYDAALEAIIQTFTTRFNAIDKATDKFEFNLTHVPTDVDKQVSRLRELVYETFKTVDVKFASVQTEFILRDVAVKQTATDTKVAVDAALKAAENAVQKQNESFALSIDKSEAATAKQIDALLQTYQTEIRALNVNITDLKEWRGRLEGLGVGTAAAQTTQQVTHSASQVDRSYSTSLMISIVMGIVALAALAAALLKP